MRGGFHYLNSSDGAASNLVVLLHGSGDDAAKYAELFAQLRLPQTCGLVVSAPVTLPFGLGNAWFDAFDFDSGGGDVIAAGVGERRRLDSLRRTARPALRALLVAARACGWNDGDVFLLGWGHGAQAAVDLVSSARPPMIRASPSSAAAASSSSTSTSSASSLPLPLRIGGVVALHDCVMEERLAAADGGGAGGGVDDDSRSNGDDDAAAALFLHATPLLFCSGDAALRRRTERALRRANAPRGSSGGGNGGDSEKARGGGGGNASTGAAAIVVAPFARGRSMLGDADDARRVFEFLSQHFRIKGGGAGDGLANMPGVYEVDNGRKH
jgi:predicted esterase